MANKHMPWDLAQMQSLPLEAKIRMTQERIRIWYESWKKYTIYNTKTKKTRFVTWNEEPSERGCYVKKEKKIDGRKVEVDVLVPGTKLKPTERIEAVEDGQVYVAFSGGIDSTVLKHIVDGMYSDVPALFVNTGLEYPEIQKFVKDIKAGKYDCFNSDVEIVRPEMRFDEVLRKFGYPVISKSVSNAVRQARQNIKDGKYSLRLCQLGVNESEHGGLKVPNGYDFHKTVEKSKFRKQKYRYLIDADFESSEECCYVTKKKPANEYSKATGRKPFVGTLASESMLREKNWLRYGCNAFDAKKPQSQPLSFWTDQDILHYIKEYNVPYCSVYGDIVIDEKVDGDSVLEGQVNLIDYLGCYEPEDKLKTTGCSRTGCIYCAFGSHLEKEPNRFQRLKETHPRQYEYCINGGEMVEGKWQPSKEGLGLGKVLDYIGVKY